MITDRKSISGSAYSNLFHFDWFERNVTSGELRLGQQLNNPAAYNDSTFTATADLLP